MLTRHGAWTRLEMRLPESAYAPRGFDAGDANLRRVVGNAPTNATDPSGLVERPAVEVRATHIDGLKGRGTLGGVSITIKTNDPKYEGKIACIQFVQISAHESFTYFKTCQGISRYLEVTHTHGGATFVTSDPNKPTWNLDNHGRKDSPEYRLDDLTPLDRSYFKYELQDWPVITEELSKELQDTEESKKTIKAMEAARPNDGKVTHMVSVTATFQTFVLVDSVVVKKYTWSTGNGYYPRFASALLSGPPAKELLTDKWFKNLVEAKFPSYKITLPDEPKK
jgi:hypothetical protein